MPVSAISLFAARPKHAETVTLCRVAGQLVQLIRDGKVEPSAHIPANVLDRRHTLNAFAVRLPECRIARRAVMRQSQRFKELDLVDEVEVGELLPLRVQDRSAGVGIDDASEIRPGFCFEEDVLPVVAQLPLVLAGDEEGWAGATLAPLLAAHAPQLGERQAHPLVHDLALAQLDFADAVRLLGIAAVAHILDQKGSGARHSQQSLTRPLVRNVRRAHHQRCAGPPLRQHMDRAQRHIGLAGPALGHDPRRLGFAQVLRSAGDGECLSGERLSQKRCNARRNRVFRALKRGISFENSGPELRGVSAQILESSIHRDTSRNLV